ncbi:MAG: sugar ABC transporter permease, partial [Chloroflexota bacterium]
MEAKRDTAQVSVPVTERDAADAAKPSLFERLEDLAPTLLLWPAVIIVLFLAIFPLFVSLYLSLSRVQLVRGGYEIEFIGLNNYERLLRGSGSRNFLGRWFDDAPNFLGLEGQPTSIGWVLLATLAAFMLYMLVSHIRRSNMPVLRMGGGSGTVVVLGVVSWFIVNFLVAEEGAMAGTWFEEQYWLLTVIPGLVVIVSSVMLGLFNLLLRVVIVVTMMALAYLTAITLGNDGLPGALVVTMIFVFAGVTIQYLLGLGLALLVTQNLPGKRFFRVVFLLPMMITPVGIGFLFRMMTDTVKGPFAPLFKAAGLTDFTWVDSAFGARTAILIGDTWQWTPFMFVILLAALEGVSTEPIEAALVDGANRWQMFRFIVMPEII